jgi:hypothetical protein
MCIGPFALQILHNAGIQLWTSYITVVAHTQNFIFFFLAPSRPQNLITSFLLILSNFNDVTMFVHQNKFHLSTCQDIIIFFKVFKRKR